MATITFESYVGAGPAWADNGANNVVFSGSLTDLAVPITVAEWQAGTHVGNGTPGTDQCGANHANNVQYIDGTNMSVNGAASETINDTNLTADECTMRLHFNHTAAVAVSNALFFAFDGSVDANPAVELDIMVFEQGESNTSWTELNNDSGGVGGSGDGVALAASASATDHYWYLALSISPETVGAKNAAVKFSLTYS